MSDTDGVDQVEHGRGAVRVTSGKEAKDVSRIGDTLNSQATCSTTQSLGESVEEGWAFTVGRSDVAFLSSSASIDDSNRTASGTISELVIGVGAILALEDRQALRGTARLKLLSVLVDGETRVNDIGHRKADSILRSNGCESVNWCGSGKGCTKQSGQREGEPEPSS